MAKRMQLARREAPGGPPWLALAATALVACSSSPGLVSDSSAPRVVSRSPAPGTVDVDLSKPIQVTFSEAMDPATVTSTTLSLATADGAAIPASVTASPGNTTFALRPTRPVAFGAADVASLEVTLTTGIRDASGNALEPPATPWTFSAPAFLPVGQLGSPAATPGGAAWDAQGRLWLASVDEGTPRAATVRRFDGQAWTTLPPPSTLAAYEIALAMLPGGDPVVAWTEGTGGPSSLLVRRWSGTAWVPFGAATSELNQSTGTYATGPSLAVDVSTGQPVVGWVEDGPYPFAAVAKRWNGSAFALVGGAVVPFSSVGVYADPADARVSLALDGSTVLLAWTELDPGNSRSTVRVHSSVAGTGAWTPLGAAVSVNAGVGTRRPALAVDGGTPVMAFYEVEACPTCPRLLQVMKYANGWVRVGSQELNRQGVQQASNPALRVEGPGRYLVAWQETPTPGKAHLSRWDGTQWAPLESLGLRQSLAGVVAEVALALDAGGVPCLAWSETGPPGLFVRRANR